MKKRVLSLLLVLLMVGTLVPTAAFADDTGVAVDRINFPDDAFRAYVSENCDTDDNGYLSDEEISRVGAIDVGDTRSTADTIRAWFQDTISTVKNLLDKLFGKN